MSHLDLRVSSGEKEEACRIINILLKFTEILLDARLLTASFGEHPCSHPRCKFIFNSVKIDS